MATKIKAVFLEWDDSHSFGTWQETSKAIAKCGPFLCQSVAYIVHETKTHMTIAAHVCIADGKIQSVHGDMTIPKRVIKRRQEIRIPKL